jgi:DNA-binding Xre family transcriptional regulator
MKTTDWHLRLKMAERGIYQTTDLVPLLAERGVHLSREQVYRMVTQRPQRISMDTLAALCDILECGVEDIIGLREVDAQAERKRAGVPAKPAVRKTTIRRPKAL